MLCANTKETQVSDASTTVMPAVKTTGETPVPQFCHGLIDEIPLWSSFRSYGSLSLDGRE